MIPILPSLTLFLFLPGLGGCAPDCLMPMNGGLLATRTDGAVMSGCALWEMTANGLTSSAGCDDTRVFSTSEFDEDMLVCSERPCHVVSIASLLGMAKETGEFGFQLSVTVQAESPAEFVCSTTHSVRSDECARSGTVPIDLYNTLRRHDPVGLTAIAVSSGTEAPDFGQQKRCGGPFPGS